MRFLIRGRTNSTQIIADLPYLGKNIDIFQDNFICCNKELKLCNVFPPKTLSRTLRFELIRVIELILDEEITGICTTMINDDINIRCPFLSFRLPLAN